MLEEYMRHFVTASQRNWVDLLDTTQFCYNLHKSSATEMSPFDIVLGRQPMTPLDVAKMKSQWQCPVVYNIVRDRSKMISKAQNRLRKAQRRMKKYADQDRHPLECG